LSDWFFRNEHCLVLTGDIVKEKARWFFERIPEYNGLPEPILSDGWLARFKGRHNIRLRVRHGEAGSVDESTMAADIAYIQAKVAQYAPTDQYNCDETGLIWKSVPDRSLSSQAIPSTVNPLFERLVGCLLFKVSTNPKG
jgi:hypothetical protein